MAMQKRFLSATLVDKIVQRGFFPVPKALKESPIAPLAQYKHPLARTDPHLDALPLVNRAQLDPFGLLCCPGKAQKVAREHSSLGARYRRKRPNGDPIGGHSEIRKSKQYMHIAERQQHGSDIRDPNLTTADAQEPYECIRFGSGGGGQLMINKPHKK